MAKYNVVLFDQSTGTEYAEVVEAVDTAEAQEKAIDKIHTFICELEGINDPHYSQQVLEDLLKRDPKVSRAA